MNLDLFSSLGADDQKTEATTTTTTTPAPEQTPAPTTEATTTGQSQRGEIKVQPAQMGAYYGGEKSVTQKVERDGNNWLLETKKTSGGRIVTTAKIVKEQDNGMTIISFSFVFGQKEKRSNRVVLTTNCARVTERALFDHHAKAFELFMKEEHENPTEDEQKKANEVIKRGLILFDSDKCYKRAITEVKGPNQYRVVYLDGSKFGYAQYIRPYSEKLGIGIYYDEGKYISEENLKQIEAKATENERKAREAEQQAKEEAEQKKREAIERGSKIITAIPSWAEKVIICGLYTDESDSQTDYFHESQTDRIYLAFSAVSRNNMQELKQAADRWTETASKFGTAVQNKEFECTDSYEGYYLGDRYRGGMKIKKVSMPSLEELQEAAGLGKFFCELERKTSRSTEGTNTGETPTDIELIQYSDRCYVLKGEGTKLISEELRTAGFKYNRFLKCGAGWLVPSKRLDEIKQRYFGE